MPSRVQVTVRDRAPEHPSRRVLRAILAAAVVMLAGCGDNVSAPEVALPVQDHRDPSDVTEGAREITVRASSFSFDPKVISVEPGEDIAVALTSRDGLHDFTIDGLDAHVAAEAGMTAIGGFRADKPGRYTFYCSVDGHREAGMEGTLDVRV